MEGLSTVNPQVPPSPDRAIPFFAQPVRVERAYELLAAAIRARILSGELEDGDRLPSETALAQEAQVSRSTVREALRVLQEAGFIERASPKVMVVRSPTDEPAHRELERALRQKNVTFAALHEALLFFEPALTRLATMRATPEDIRALEANVDEQERHVASFETWERLDQEFHLAIAEISANPALMLARAPITQLLMPALQALIRSEEQTTIAVAQHRRMLEEIVAGDTEAADLMTKRHINDFRRAWESAGYDVDAPVASLAGDGLSLGIHYGHH
jgi:DNA-binding FadR family transcriptional regulator